jgi:hypothetical protein
VAQPSSLISVIICSIDARKFANVTATYQKALDKERFEIIGIHDAQSLAEGYARGIAASRGELSILSHDDIRILTTDFSSRLVANLAVYDLIGIAGTTKVVGASWMDAGDPYLYTLICSPETGSGRLQTVMLGGGPVVAPGIQALDGVFMAMRREVAETVAFDAQTFDGFHLYDLDFSFRAFQSGRQLPVCRDILIIHDSIGSYDAIWEKYALLFKDKHRASLPPSWLPLDGARASFFAATEDEVLARCGVDKLVSILGQIEKTNAQLL